MREKLRRTKRMNEERDHCGCRVSTFLKAKKWKGDLAKLRVLNAKCLPMGWQCKWSQSWLWTPQKSLRTCKRLCVWQAGVQVWEANQEHGLKVSRKHSQTPRFSPLLHRSRQRSLPHPARIPEDFYSMEKLSGSTFRMPGEGEGEMCVERRI